MRSMKYINALVVGGCLFSIAAWGAEYAVFTGDDIRAKDTSIMIVARFRGGPGPNSDAARVDIYRANDFIATIENDVVTLNLREVELYKIPFGRVPLSGDSRLYYLAQHIPVNLSISRDTVLFGGNKMNPGQFFDQITGNVSDETKSPGIQTEQTEAKSQAPESISYPVQQGDTWETISKSFGIPVDKLHLANPELAKDRRLEPGELVTIP